MKPLYWTTERVAGILLVSGFMLDLIALVILIARGAFSAYSATIAGNIEQMLLHPGTFRLTTFMFAVSWILPLLGFGLLALVLGESGDKYLAITAFVLIAIASILGILYSTFRMSVEPWAAQQLAETGNLPIMYEFLKDWIGSAFKIGYLTYFAGVALFGWAILRSEPLPDWVGLVAIGWSLVWLLGGLFGAGAPALPLIIPAVIGAALILK